jgi:hypothetical protein
MPITFFDINTEEPTFLGQYCKNRITITKIIVIEGEINDLFSPIKLITNLPSGEGFQYFIHASNFFSNKNPGKETDLKIDIDIRYCNYTSMIISKMSGKRLVFRIQYLPFEEEPLKLVMKTDIDGYTFTLTSESKELILSRFKDANPIRNIFVGFDVKYDFQLIYGRIEKYLIPTLTGLTETQLSELGHIQVLDAMTNQIITTLNYAKTQN